MSQKPPSGEGLISDGATPDEGPTTSSSTRSSMEIYTNQSELSGMETISPRNSESLTTLMKNKSKPLPNRPIKPARVELPVKYTTRTSSEYDESPQLLEDSELDQSSLSARPHLKSALSDSSINLTYTGENTKDRHRSIAPSTPSGWGGSGSSGGGGSSSVGTPDNRRRFGAGSRSLTSESSLTASWGVSGPILEETGESSDGKEEVRRVSTSSVLSPVTSPRKTEDSRKLGNPDGLKDRMKKQKKLLTKFIKKKDEKISDGDRQAEDERRKKTQEWHKKQLEQAVQHVVPNLKPVENIPRIEKEAARARPKVVVQQIAPQADLGIEKIQVESSSEQDKKREFIVKELLHTEKTYIESLEDAMKKYYEPMLAESEIDTNIDKEVINKIFFNMKLILPINRNHLYDVLQERVTNWTPTTEVGDLFVDFAHLLKMYTQYSNSYDTAIKSLELIASQPWFGKFCQAKVLIESLLIMPIQRIPRYSLLLTDLYRNTPINHPDNANLLKALTNIRNTAAHVNEGIAKHKNFDKLTSEGLTHLLAAHRTLAIDEALQVVEFEDCRKKTKQKQKKDYKLLLFNDIFVFMPTTFKKNKDPEYLDQWPCELLWLERKENCIIKIIGPCQTLSVNCVVPEVQERWWQTIVQVVDKRIEHSQTHLKDFNFTQSSLQLNVRQGTMKFKNGAMYQGWWDRGAMHGRGIFEYSGSVYEGDFIENIREGTSGAYYYADGTVYRGEWRAGKPNGRGELVTLIGDKYIGEWKDGKRCGQGEMFFSNGDKFVGSWEGDNMNGMGSLVLQNGITYVGLFEKGLYHGEGTLTTKQGTFFGVFEHGVKNGHGNMKWTNKSIYDGMWKNGLPHGTGKKHDTLGFYEGDWYCGMRKGHGVMVYKDGSTYDGHWVDDKRHNFGVFENASGHIQTYKGEWVKDKKCGKGYILFSNGDQWEGFMDNDQPHGHGILTSKSFDGMVVQVEGKWYRGMREGKFQTRVIQYGEVVNQMVVDPEECSDFMLPPFLPVISWDH